MGLGAAGGWQLIEDIERVVWDGTGSLMRSFAMQRREEKVVVVLCSWRSRDDPTLKEIQHVPVLRVYDRCNIAVLKYSQTD